MNQTQEPDYRRKVLSSLAWMGSAQFFGQLLTWTSTILVIRLLDPSDYGLRAMTTVFFSLLLMLSDLGIGSAIVQADKISNDEARYIQGFIVLFNLAGFALTLAGASFVAEFFDEPRLIPLLYALSSCFILMATYVLPQAMLQRTLQYKRKAQVDFASMTVGALVSLGCAFLGFGVWSLIAGTIAIHATWAVGFNVAYRGVRLPRWSWGPATRFLRFGGVILIDRILWFLYSNLDVMIAGKLLGKEILGFYAVALTLSSLPLQKAMPIVNQVAFSAFSRIQEDSRRVRDNVLRAIRYGFAMILPVLWGLALVAPDGVPLVLGEDWRHVIVPIQLISIILPLKAVSMLLPPALFGVGRAGVSAVNMAITVALMAPAFFVGAQFGLVGLATSWLVTFPVVFAVIAIRALPVLGVSLADFWISVRATLISGFAMAGVVLAVQVGTVDFAPPLRLLASVTAGALAYVGMMRLVDRTAISELRELLAR
jgi:teichuronic acid exporter